MANYLFLHAHPDDEAIFTGGIIRQLVDNNNNVTIVFATGGELGTKQDPNSDLQNIRKYETQKAGEILGVQKIEYLKYHDSGLIEAEFPQNAFATCDIENASIKLNEIVENNEIDILICDDEYGIYGHPDHKQAHRIGTHCTTLKNSRIKELYFSTVDREYLHFVETHLVEEANSAISIFDLANKTMGMSSVEITHTLNISNTIEVKRRAMRAHSSQINDTSSALTLSDEEFSAVYGYEWLIKSDKNSTLNSLLKYCI